MKDIRNMTHLQITELVVSLGEKAFRSKQIYEWATKGVSSFDEMTNVSSQLREKLSTVCMLDNYKIIEAIKAKDESAFIKKQREIIEFCKTPKTRQQLVEFIGLSSASHAIKTYVKPLVDRGLIMLSIPDKPSSSKQIYTSVDH